MRWRVSETRDLINSMLNRWIIAIGKAQSWRLNRPFPVRGDMTTPNVESKEMYMAMVLESKACSSVVEILRKYPIFRCLPLLHT